MTQNNEREKLDVRYFNEKLRLVLEGLPNYTRSELARELQRLSNTASPISQNEQQPKQIPDGWKPIETAKKEYGYILAFEAGHGIKITWWDSKHDNVGGWRCHGHGWRPTHWMPLPPAPTNTEVGND
ncbi:MAG: hypothetical protein CTY32_08335 [Methylotenera sp.]|nr:MAG: hypothetical protein CTY32_08335 [Methylotenera sp.]